MLLDSTDVCRPNTAELITRAAEMQDRECSDEVTEILLIIGL
jgi:hypothetical protein